MAIDIKNIADLLKKQVSDVKLENQVVDVGEVVFSGDGIIKVKGLKNVKYYEVLAIENGASAIALNLEEEEVGAVVLDDDGSIAQGMQTYECACWQCIARPYCRPIGQSA